MKNASNQKRAISIPADVFKPDSPYNWDFRRIPKSLLYDAIQAEYLRTWVELRHAAVDWLQKTIKGKSTRNRIIAARQQGNEWFPADVFDCIPPAWRYAFLFLWDDPAYPAPFTWLLEKGFISERLPTAGGVRTEIAPGLFLSLSQKEINIMMGRVVKIHKMDKQRVAFVSKMLNFPEIKGIYGYHLEINFERHRNKEIVKSFANWLEFEAKKMRKTPVHGRASEPKWYRLKQLAAKRLNDAGLTYKAASSLVAARKWEVPINGVADVLPSYSSQGAWTGAVKDANLFIQYMQNNYNLDGWELY